MGIENIISAFSSAWISILGVALILGMILFRNQIKDLIGRLTKIKWENGETKAEIECSQDNSSSNAEINTIKETNETNSTNEDIKLDLIETKATSKTQEIDIQSLYKAYIDRNIEELKSIFLELEKKEINNDQKLKNKAFYFSALFRLGETSAIDELAQLVEQNSNTKLSFFINRMLANCYENTNQLEKASELYVTASINTTDEFEKVIDITNNTNILRKLGQKAEAYIIIQDTIKSVNDRNALFKLYEKLAEYYKEDNEKLMSLISLEKALELKPNNSSTYFTLAYEYSSVKLWEASGLLNYKKLLEFDPKNSSALNNIGVAYDNLGLKEKSIINYSKAFEEGNSLAAANMANTLISTGFTSQAKELLEKAEVLSNVSPNVKSAIVRLDAVTKEEDEREKEYLEKASKIQRFLRNYGEVYFRKEKMEYSIQGSWKGDDSSLLFLEENGTVIGIFKEGSNEERLIFETRYDCGEFKIQKQSYEYSLSKYIFKENGKGYMYFSQDKKNLNMMLLRDGKCSIYNMMKQI